ncbi:MAG TPA: peptidoglycan-binding domain-containing protein, partial [Nitrososphaeraceae archaeon]|nr:peptidoglycan-binding domain-containing protein [Nitrososphaeraceae archaeon]
MIMFPSMKTFAQCDSTPPTLEYGASGNEVKVLQQLLQNSGHDPGSIDGKFGPNTRNAIIKLQEANGLVMDGKVGPQTWNVLCGFANTGPTTSGPTTSGPTTSGPTTSGPTTSGPTTSGPTTSGPTTSG